MADAHLEADRLEALQTAGAVALPAEHARRTMGDPGVYAATLPCERDEARALLRDVRGYLRDRDTLQAHDLLARAEAILDGRHECGKCATLASALADAPTPTPRPGWREVRPGDWRYDGAGFALSVGRAEGVCLYFWGEARGGNVVADGHAPTLAAAMLAAERSAGVTP